MMQGFTEQTIYTRFDLLALRECLLDKGIISLQDHHLAVQKVAVQALMDLDGLFEASVETMIEKLRERRDIVQ